MNIDQTAYDQKPLFIRQGALQLWGIPLAWRVDVCRTRQLYRFGEFYAEMCFDKQTGNLTCICTFTRDERLALYLDQISLSDLGHND